MYSRTSSGLSDSVEPHQSHLASTASFSLRIWRTSVFPSIMTAVSSLVFEHLQPHLTCSSHWNLPTSSLIRCSQMASGLGRPRSSMRPKDAMFASTTPTSASSQPGSSVTRKPSACFTQPASRSHSTLRPMEAGVCSLSARYCTMSSATSPDSNATVPVYGCFQKGCMRETRSVASSPTPSSSGTELASALGSPRKARHSSAELDSAISVPPGPPPWIRSCRVSPSSRPLESRAAPMRARPRAIEAIGEAPCFWHASRTSSVATHARTETLPPM
mmetsp:Transcript_72278/g.189423  ORF Transcript_72278/g.189423 Transcript_72278/m.189423 type:complete len:274 (+) Transcript_72278:157-978(+)